MPLSTKLDQKLRAEDSSDGESYYEVSDRSSPSIIETGEGADILSESEDDENDAEKRLSKVSFGALAKAQASLSKSQPQDRKRKRGDEAEGTQEDKLQALRERLRALKEEKLAKQGGASAPASKKSKPSSETKTKSKTGTDSFFNEDSDSEASDNSDSDSGPKKARSSKHAPMVQSSKRAVTRRRAAVEVKKPTFRDPRFDNVAGPLPDENTMAKRYGFLDEYKNTEISELRSALKKAKTEDEKARIKKTLLSMESQKKARDKKAKQQEVIREHKKKEKEMVKEGKQPFYLKKCMCMMTSIYWAFLLTEWIAEQKKLAIIDEFKNMKGKQREHVLERRRKKIAHKERKNMPMDRRAA